MADQRAVGPAVQHGQVITGGDAALAALQGLLGHGFADLSLLRLALTHPSAALAQADPTYQRLEFLGDRVLGVVVADMLFEAFPRADEGELSRRFNDLVRRETCAEVARDIGLGGFVLLGAGEAQSGGRAKPAILADVCEAVIGALFRDGGYPAARRFVESNWRQRLAGADASRKDAKTTLQEWAHARGLEAPVYTEIARAGPDHAPEFTVAVAVEGLPPEQGRGASKRVAEQHAAETLLTREGAWMGEGRNNRS